MKLEKAFKVPPLNLQKHSLIYPALWQMVCVCAHVRACMFFFIIIIILFNFYFYCMSHYSVQYYMHMISSVSIMLNASIPLFHQHLVFIVYESPLVS